MTLAKRDDQELSRRLNEPNDVVNQDHSSARTTAPLRNGQLSDSIPRVFGGEKQTPCHGTSGGGPSASRTQKADSLSDVHPKSAQEAWLVDHWAEQMFDFSRKFEPARDVVWCCEPYLHSQICMKTSKEFGAMKVSIERDCLLFNGQVLVEMERHVIRAEGCPFGHGFVLLPAEEDEEGVSYAEDGLRTLVASADEFESNNISVERDGTVEVHDSKFDVVEWSHRKSPVL